MLDEIAANHPELMHYPSAIVPAVMHVIRCTHEETRAYYAERAIEHLNTLWGGIAGKHLPKKVQEAYRKHPDEVYRVAVAGVQHATMAVLAQLGEMPDDDEIGEPVAES